MVRDPRHVPIPRLLLVLLIAAGILPGCGIVPRSRMEESQKLSQLLRAENAQLKDQVLSLQSQNRDYADRAVDDLRRLTAARAGHRAAGAERASLSGGSRTARGRLSSS